MITAKTLEKILDEFEKGTLESFESKISDLKEKKIILYGAGNIGKKLYKSFVEDNIEVLCFLDRNEKLDLSNYDIEVYKPESQDVIKFKETAYVILSGLFKRSVCNEIKENLRRAGFKNIFALHEINLSKVNNGNFYDDLFNPTLEKNDIAGKEKQNIIEAFSLLEKDEDRELFIEYVSAHLTKDFSKFKEPHDVSLQYLAHDIPIEKNYNNFIDCGGYDGDTIRSFVENNLHMNNIAIFEPQNDLCEKIYEYTEKNNDIFKTVTIFPCGVSSKFQKVKFLISNDSPSSAKVNDEGTDTIQCVAIDQVLQGFKPTFIKMDIEGAELEALEGAKNSIINNHPQLAICVYHSLSDIWQIPLLINSFYSGYKFYLRSYNYMGFETVLYAFPDR